MNQLPHYGSIEACRAAHPDLGVLGWRMQGEAWRPILWRPDSRWARCSVCSGYGSSGMPMAGYLRVCEPCGGTGLGIVYRTALRFFGGRH